MRVFRFSSVFFSFSVNKPKFIDRLFSFFFYPFLVISKSVDRKENERMIIQEEVICTRKKANITKRGKLKGKQFLFSKHPIQEKHKLLSFTRWEIAYYVTKIFTFTQYLTVPTKNRRFLKKKIIIVGLFKSSSYNTY